MFPTEFISKLPIHRNCRFQTAPFDVVVNECAMGIPDDMRLEKNLLTVLEDFQPHIVGITAYTVHVNSARMTSHCSADTAAHGNCNLPVSRC